MIMAVMYHRPLNCFIEKVMFGRQRIYQVQGGFIRGSEARQS